MGSSESSSGGAQAYFVVVAQAVYAARVWPAEVIPSGDGSPHLVGLNPDSVWEWFVCLDAQSWECIGDTFVLSTENAGEVGFLKLRAWEHPRPALAHALLQKGGRRLLANQVKRFADDQKISAGDGREKALLEKTLAGHPDQSQLVATWSPPRPTRKRQQTKVGGDESSSAEEEEVEDDDEHDWMTEAALGANPDDQEYKALRTRFAQKQLAKKVEEAMTTLLSKTSARGASALDNSLGEDGTCQIDQEEPPKEGLDAGGATVAQDTQTENPRAKCSIKWCRQYMPGHPLSGVPEAPRTQKGQLHTDQLAKSRTQWIARLEIEGDTE